MDGIYLKDIMEVKVQLDNGWEVYYDDGLYLEDPDEIEPKKLSGHIEDVIGLFKLKNKRFLSIAKDNTIIIWSFKGKKQVIFNCETSVSGISLINDDEIMILLEDGRVELFNIKEKKKLTTFNVRVDNFDKIEVYSDFLSFITLDGSLDVCRYDGTVITSFKNQTELFNAWIFFPNNYCLTKSQEGKIQLWSDSGEEIVQLNEKFSFDSDLLLLDDDYFCFVDNGNEICIYDFKGQKHASTKADLVNLTKQYIANEKKLQKQKVHNNIIDFPHKNNFVSKKTFIPSSVMLENGIELQNENNTFLWNFFNRPLFGPIQKLLKKEEKIVKKYRKKMYEIKNAQELNIKENEAKIEKLISKIDVTKKSKKRVGYITLFFLIISIIFGYITYDATTQLKNKGKLPIQKEKFNKYVQYHGLALLDYKTRNTNSFSENLKSNLLTQIEFVASASVLLFLIFLLILKSKNSYLKQLENDKSRTEEENKVLKSSIETIEILMKKAFDWLSSTNTYRLSIMKQIPVLKDQNLYNGSKVKEIIDNKIHNELEAYALQECGITKDDIEFTDINGTNNREAIIWNEWSKIQDKSNNQMAKKIIDHNEMSFWSTKEGDMIFAVQYIQFIFLTKDKIDVFNSYYDFITNKFIAKQSRTYYYKDVTNTSKKDIVRQTLFQDESIPATEITLQVSSGDSINLTVINEETKAFLGKNFTDDEEEEDRGTKVQELKERLEEIKADHQMSQEDKEDNIALINGQITSIENASVVINELQTQEFNKADMTIQNIRAQIRNHKIVAGNA